MKIFGKLVREYFLPIKYYILGSVLVVISQYYVASPLAEKYPFALNLTQALWALMVALSVLKLVKECNFGMKNIIMTGIFYSLIIHGLKAFFFRVFLFPYSLPAGEIPAYLMGKFLYGSSLVMIIAVILGTIFIYARKRKLL